MTQRMSPTDQHWNQRAASVADDIEVNIMDIFQREFEYDNICKHLTDDMIVLEVGCGNGFSTDRFRALAKHVDAFDYAENMIQRARETFGETNNRFIHDNLLAPKLISGFYDTVICVRVLINLQDLDEQTLGIHNMLSFLKPGGLLILVEGFKEGFEALSELRQAIDLGALEPAKINFYSSLDNVLPEIEKTCTIIEKFHLGAYDYLTRVFYPLVVGPNRLERNSVFNEKASVLARAFNPDIFETFSRVRGFVFKKHA